MKTLYLLRHAKSSWKYTNLTDFERPLNSRGKKDAPFIGQLMFKRGIKPDIIITSPAKRAITTARLFAHEAGYNVEDIVSHEKMYGATPDDLIEICRSTDESYNSVMFVGHNPTLTYMAEIMSNCDIDNIPTAAIFCINFEVNSWSQIEAGKGKRNFFEYPKKYTRR